MNRTAIIAVIVIALVAGGLIYVKSSKITAKPSMQTAKVTSLTQPQPTAQESTAPNETSPTGAAAEQGAEKEFTVTGSNFSFDPKEIKVKKGDTVKILFKNADGFHDWRVDEFNAATKKIKGGEQDSVQFVAEKAGTFEYYCSVGEHRQMGMKGNLVVE
jgi:plastocyanin